MEAGPMTEDAVQGAEAPVAECRHDALRREIALIDIADDGPGIPADAREHVFDSFFTTKDVGHGTGLGLATAHRIVADRHDGALTVESAPGRTVFHVRIPLHQPVRSDK
jgi:signal transduction histidine kinase